MIARTFVVAAIWAFVALACIAECWVTWALLSPESVAYKIAVLHICMFEAALLLLVGVRSSVSIFSRGHQ